MFYLSPFYLPDFYVMCPKDIKYPKGYYATKSNILAILNLYGDYSYLLWFCQLFPYLSNINFSSIIDANISPGGDRGKEKEISI